jgi:hypothetical protein
MEHNHRIKEAMERLKEGCVVELTVQKSGNQKETLRLVATDVQSDPEDSVTQFWEEDADLDRDNMELLEEGYRQVNLQSARRHSRATSRGYRYEVRGPMNDDIDGSPVVELKIVA